MREARDRAWWAQYRRDKRDRIREVRRAWAKANRGKMNAMQRRYRAKRRNSVPEPGYWRYESTGVLRPAVEAYLSGGPMTPEQIAAMRAYCRQWINAPWPGDAANVEQLRRLVDHIDSRPTLAAWIAAATDLGIDPL
jgi:hypothetical protein